MAKHVRLPNGFGQITKLKNPHLRNPYRAMVTVGIRDNGKPLCKVLSYHKTYNEAYTALVDYNRNPTDLNENMTVGELYNIWFKHHYTDDTPLSTLNGVKAAWSHCEKLNDLQVTTIKVKHIKQVLDSPDLTSNTRSRVKQVLSMMFDYAIQCEIVEKNPARIYVLPKEDLNKISKTENPHEAFTENEIEILRQTDSQTAEILYFCCYSGWRPREVLDLRIENINEGYMTGGSKTEAGKDRTVPIHPKISIIAKKNQELAVARGSKFLFSMDNGRQIPYINLYKNTKSLMKKLGLDLNHRPHDARKTFVTLCKKYKVDEYAIKRMIGHAIDDLTERVYTDRPLEWLKEQILCIEATM